MKNKVSFEFRRKSIHVLLGLILILLIYFDLLPPLFLACLIVLGIILSIIERRHRLPILSIFLDLFERTDARKKKPGEALVLYLAGAFLAIILLPKQIAMASIAVLAIGDAVSHTAGISFGKIKHPLNDKKFVEGWLVGLLAAFMAALLFLNPFEAFAAAFAGMIVEAFEIVVMGREINDNLVIPPAAGLAVLLVRLIKL